MRLRKGFSLVAMGQETLRKIRQAGGLLRKLFLQNCRTVELRTAHASNLGHHLGCLQIPVLEIALSLFRGVFLQVFPEARTCVACGSLLPSFSHLNGRTVELPPVFLDRVA